MDPKIGGDPIEDFERIRRALGIGNNESHININAGGPALWVAVWVSTICCAVMLATAWSLRSDNLKQQLVINEQQRRLDLANDKLSIILQWAPELAKKVDQQISQKKDAIP